MAAKRCPLRVGRMRIGAELQKLVRDRLRTFDELVQELPERRQAGSDRSR